MSEVTAVSFLPGSGVYVDGIHEAMPGNPTLLASLRYEKIMDKLDASYKPHTKMLSPQLRNLVAAVAQHKTKILSGSLTAADYEANRENLDKLILILLDKEIRGQQMKWFHLDNMYNSFNLDSLEYRMTFKDSPASAKKVGRREPFDTAHVAYDEIQFYLEKYVTSWDMPIEDPLRALINPTIPLQQNNEWSMAYLREKEAAKGLEQLKYRYKKDGTGAGKFSGTTKQTTDATAISNPETLDTAGFHSKTKVVNQIQNMRNEFLKEFDLGLTHFACSPKTAMQLAQNTWTAPNTINNVEAYRTNGGVRAFPGLSEATMVISLALPDNTLYCACKPENVLMKAEGPKISKTWEDHLKWTTQTAHADFFQYKCAHENLTMDRKFGIIVDIHSG